MAGDLVTLDSSAPSGDAGDPLIQPVMRAGRRLHPQEPFAAIRARAKRELERLPEPLRRLDADATYPVEISAALRQLAADVDQRLRHAANETS
jgi:nicotinate phosphoribosyltransferase